MTGKKTNQSLVQKIQALENELAQRRETEDALRRSEQRCRLMIEAAGDIVFTVDQSGTFLYISPTCQAVLGYAPADFVGKHFQLFVHPDDAGGILKALQVVFEQAREGESAGVSQSPVEYRALAKNGQWKWLAARNAVVDKSSGQEELLCIARDITEQKEAVRKLEESQERYRFLVEESNDIIWTFDLSTMTYVYCSKSVERILGFPQEETIGIGLDNAFSPETENRVRAEFSRILSGNSDSERVLLEAEHLRKDGGSVWMEINAVLHRDDQGRPLSFSGVSRDITERKRSQEALRQSEEKYRTIIETIEDGYFEVDLAGSYTFCNEALCRMLGYTRDELMGLNYRAYMSPHYARKALETFSRVYQTGEPLKALDWELIGKEGEICFIETSVSLARDARGQVVGFRGISRNITERRIAEKEKEKLQARLRHAHQMEAIGTLAGGIAHDFNNILSSVIGYTELSLDEVEKDSLVHGNLSQVLASGNRAKALVKQILALSRREKQAFNPVDVSTLVRETMKMLRSTIPASIDFREQISDEQLIVYADPSQLQQVVVNLATNAGHAMADAGGALEIRVERFCLDAQTEKPHPDAAPGDYVRISVSDTGTGIPEQYMQKIFEPYFTTRKEGTGTGLGLSIVHGIVRGHKGYMTIDSRPGRGSTFHVHLPLMPPEPA